MYKQKHSIKPVKKPNAIALALATVVFPLSSASAELEEVVVMAQKRNQSLQDVPVAVSVMSGEKVAQNNIVSLEQFSQFIPNVTITDSTAGEQLFIRGLGSGANEGFEQSVGTYVDGIYYGRGRSAKTGFVDLERVEVLKGPQGVLFGKNTIAGAINITTRNPSDEFEAGLKLGYEFEHEEKLIQGVLSGPVTDTFGLRLAVRSTEHDGWMENTFLNQNSTEKDELAARLTGVWQPASNLEIATKLQYTDLKLGDTAVQLVDCSDALRATVAGVDDCRFDNKTTISLNSPDGENSGFEDNETFSAGITAEWELDNGFIITSVTGYTELESRQALEIDFTHLDILSAAPRDEEFDNFSQELRIASPLGETLEYILGVYYERSDLFRTNSFNVGPITRVGASQQDGESTAFFGSLTWRFDEYWSATFGGRYTDDEKDLRKTQFFAAPKTTDPLPIPSVPGLGTRHDVEHDRSDSDFSPTVTLTWTPNQDLLFYATYAQGFKAGGFDFSSGQGDLDIIEFDPEEVESFELGAKTSFFDNSMQFNVAVFHSEFSDLQVSTFDGQFALLVGNAAEAVTDGLELDLRWALSERLTAAFAVAFLDAEYDSYETAQCTADQTAATPAGQPCLQDMSGKDLSFAADFSGNLSLNYQRPIGSGLHLRASTDVNFTDDYWVAGDADPRSLEDGYAKLNARASLEAADADWSVGLLALNITDEKTSHWSNDVPGSPGSYYRYLDRTRTVMLFTEYNF